MMIARLHSTTADDIANLQFYQSTTAQLAVDGKFEQSTIPEPLFVVEKNRIAQNCFT